MLRPTTARRKPPKIASKTKETNKADHILEEVSTNGVLLDGEDESSEENEEEEIQRFLQYVSVFFAM